jgi:hypothetical protein
VRRGALAQLVEQLTLNQPVPGSSPGRLTITSNPDATLLPIPGSALPFTNAPQPAEVPNDGRRATHALKARKPKEQARSSG